MQNQTLYEQACRVIPGGVNSPVRAFRSVGGSPVFISRAKGSRVFAEDGTGYIDYVGSWGPMILGHAHPDVVSAVALRSANGLSFGAPTVIETEMAELVCRRLPWVEQVRMVNSGTEATMSAIRLARGFTGRDRIIKFEGCYHGHADSLLVKAGSGALTLGVPTSPGVPADTVKDTLTAGYNDLDSVQRIFDSVGDEVAAVILEPVAGNMNCVPPVEGFLEGLRSLCDRHGSLLIMDEVMTGFRVGYQGAQGRYGVPGDITVLGKIIGGGMPVGAFGARAEIMSHLAPEGGVYQAGTLSGNPVAMAAGIATLRGTEAQGFYQSLEQRTGQLVEGILEAAGEQGIPMRSNRVGAMFGLFFTDRPAVTGFADVGACDNERFNRFFHGMLEEGVYLAPSAFEAGFVSAAHTEEDIAATVDAARRVFARIG